MPVQMRFHSKTKSFLRKAKKRVWTYGCCMFVFGGGGLERQVLFVWLVPHLFVLFLFSAPWKENCFESFNKNNDEMFKKIRTLLDKLLLHVLVSKGERDASSGKVLVLLVSIMSISLLVFPSVVF